MPRNPPWSRDERLIALEFYLRFFPNIPNKNSPEIVELSNFLNRLQDKCGGERPPKFRNPTGVYMTLMNIQYLDPRYKGGLSRGAQYNKVVWDRYFSDPETLKKLTDNIRSFVVSDNPLPLWEPISEYEKEAEEGQILTRIHRFRERNGRLIKRKKDEVFLEKGALSCEVCDFDFMKRYGDRGERFIECHHIKPISTLRAGERTEISDLSLLCSNCHRMIHRQQPWWSLDELKEKLQTQ